MTLAPGTRLGPYEIVAPLGSGGMGEVFRARDARLGREVALKVLPADVASDPDRLARLEREAKAAAALSHPNIVTLFSLEEAAGRRFLTMELVEGEGLDRRICRGGLPPARVLDLAIPLADALAAAHAHGVVHRDLKPSNVMVTREGRLKVLDFGLAKMTAPASAADAAETMTMVSPLSSAGQVVGTVPYMAPEQLRGGAVDARADLFSLGIILYEMATGSRPFEGATSAEVSSAILRDVPAPARSLRGDLPADLERIIGRCLEKDPERRIQTAKDVRNELELARRALDSSASILSGAPAYPRSAPVPRGGPSAPEAPHAPTAPSPSVPSGAPIAQEVPSIAVLPFANRSRDEDDAYFADGLTDELLSVLAKIRGLRVAARSSAFTFKGKEATVSEVGRVLNVATVLEGSVRKSGNRVRIAVQLVKVADGYQIWAETYDRTLDDIFAVQDDIAQAVVKELRSTLLGEVPDSETSGEVKAEIAAAARGRAENEEAHRLFLQGRFLIERLSREDVKRGIEHLRQALVLEPGHALAWAWIARAYWHEAGYGWVPIAEGEARAREAAKRALDLEPDLVEGHVAMGMIQAVHDWDWKEAEASYRRALELAPGDAQVLRAAGSLARDRGRLEEAIALHRRAVDRDPLNPGGYVALGMTCRFAGLLPQAEAAYRRALEISPQRTGARLVLSLIVAEQGRIDEALRIAEQELEEWARLCALAAVHWQAGRQEESSRALQQLIAKYAGDAAYQIAANFAAREEKDEAFAWLERAYAQRDAGLSAVRLEPVFNPLHADPRWEAFLQRMGLAD